MSVKVRIDHLPQVQAAITKRANAIQPALRRASPQARRLLVAALSRYPAPRPGQTYRRTQELKRGWHRATPLDQGTGFELVTPTAHANLVQGERQAWMHRGRWRPAHQIAQDLADQVQGAYAEQIEDATS
jgi:hypothetical protein